MVAGEFVIARDKIITAFELSTLSVECFFNPQITRAKEKKETTYSLHYLQIKRRNKVNFLNLCLSNAKLRWYQITKA